MKNPLSRKMSAIRPSGIRKFFDVVSEMPDAISLGVGEPDFDTPWPIREAGIRSLQGGKTFYTSNSGLLELRQEACAYTERQIGNHYDPATECLITVGGSEAIDLALRCLLDPGDEVILPEPCYVSYQPCIIMADGVPVSIPLREKDDFRLQPEQLLAAITEKTKAIIFSYPNNPTGAIMEEADWRALSPILLEHDLFIITDEIYADLSYKGEHRSIASLPGMRERTVFINGFSKAFAMTGWRLGYTMAPAPIMSEMIKLHQFAIMCAPTTSQYAGIAALRDCKAEVATMRESYNQRRRFLMKTFQDLALPCFEPFGAFYAFPNISEFGMTSDEFAGRFLQEEKVAIIPGTAFGESGEGFVRISYAYSIAKLQEALGRLNTFIHRLRQERRG